MKKIVLGVLAVAALVAGYAAQPAPAVVHEIVAQWCSGHGELEPHGIADEAKKNFAMPVRAGGVVQLVAYAPGGPDAMLIDFNFDAPQSKFSAPPGGSVVVPIIPGVLYIETFVLDHVAFEHCPNFSE